jgi:hypothetical protein
MAMLYTLPFFVSVGFLWGIEIARGWVDMLALLQAVSGRFATAAPGTTAAQPNEAIGQGAAVAEAQAAAAARATQNANAPATAAAALVFALFTLLIVVAYFVFGDVAPRGAFLVLGALGVGGVSGHWFVGGEGRDKLIFVSGAAVLLTLSALDYEVRIFDRLTSFAAGGVSVALSTGQEGDDHGVREQPQLIEKQGSPFGGAARLDLAMQEFGSLGEYMLKDEQYAHLFANDVVVPGTARAFLDSLSKPSLALAVLNCTLAHETAENFLGLQGYFRSESLMSPDLAQEVIAIVKSYYSRKETLGRAFDELTKALLDLRSRSADDLNFTGREKDKDLKPKLCDNLKNTGPEFDLANIRQNEGFYTKADIDKQQYFYSVYHVLIVALAQYALGNREGSIQFLDRNIEQQKQYFQARREDFMAGGFCADDGVDCATANAKTQTLDLFRRRVTIVRLENVQDELMDAWGDRSISPERLSTLQRLSQDFGEALSEVRPGEAAHPALFRSDDRTRCPDSLPSDPVKRNLIASWSFSRTTAITNMLDIVGADSNLLKINPALGDSLDLLADYVEHFDTDCLKPYYPENHLTPAAGAQLLRAAGDYWTSRSAYFRGAETGDMRRAVLAACNAKEDYLKALASAPDVEDKNDGAYVKLDDDARKHDFELLGQRLKSSVFISRAALKENFPAALLDKYCPN